MWCKLRDVGSSMEIREEFWVLTERSGIVLLKTMKRERDLLRLRIKPRYRNGKEALRLLVGSLVPKDSASVRSRVFKENEVIKG